MIRPIPLPGDIHRPVLVGLSGGMDSTVLLHMLAMAGGHELRAIHVHHGLHADADAWAMHCRALCDHLGVPLAIANVDVDTGGGRGLEAAARDARRAAFAAELRDGEVLALAHHRDDQAETFLLRALRASGPDGLGAMRRWRTFGHGWLWRPLLETPRSELLAHARQHALQWIEDPSNNDASYDRNFIRHHALPLLRERWPHADAAFARSAMLSADASALLDEEDARALTSIGCGDARVIRVDGLRLLSSTRRARVLRRWIDGLGLPPLPAQGVSRVEADLLDAAPDAQAEFAWSGATIQRWRNLLHADLQRAPLPLDWQVAWNGREPLPLPGDGGVLRLLGASGFDAPLRVGARRGGERILLAGRAHSHSLKHLLQHLNVPPWQRARLPLLSDADGHLLAVANLVYAAEFEAWLRSNDAGLGFELG